jgi:hypothetical protein
MALNARDISLIAVFSSLWTVLQVQLGPILGQFSIGPISLHGAVNRMVGWLLMTVMADQTSAFGRISLMSAIAVLGTRSIRVNPFEGLIVGSGYALGGFTFDLLAHIKRKSSSEALVYRLCIPITIASSLVASTPYLLSRMYFLGPAGFAVASPLYFISTCRGIIFSLIGASLGLQINAHLKGLVNRRLINLIRG